MDDPIKRYLTKIGRKGGAASKGTPAAKARAQKASRARWGKPRKKKPAPAPESPSDG